MLVIRRQEEYFDGFGKKKRNGLPLEAVSPVIVDVQRGCMTIH